MPEELENQSALYKIIGERARLLILTHLAASRQPVSFNELKATLDLTAGNLSMHLKMLTDSDLVTIEKKFVNNKPLTTAEITEIGRSALEEYLTDMENMIQNLKKKLAEGGQNGTH